MIQYWAKNKIEIYEEKFKDWISFSILEPLSFKKFFDDFMNFERGKACDEVIFKRAVRVFVAALPRWRSFSSRCLHLLLDEEKKNCKNKQEIV